MDILKWNCMALAIIAIFKYTEDLFPIGYYNFQPVSWWIETAILEC